MIKLLHSKLFRQNLAKWLFMYVAVICLLTSVITYSKYISSLGNKDSNSRSAKFLVDITPMATEGVICTDKIITNEVSNGYTYSECSIKTSDTEILAFRPTKPVEFYFKIDISQMEVMSDIYVRASLGVHVDDPANSKVPESMLKITDISLVDENKENAVTIPMRSTTEGTDENANEAASGDVHRDSESTIHIRYNPPVKEENDGSVSGDTEQEKQEGAVYYIKITAQYDLTKFEKEEETGALIINSVNEKDAIRLDYSATQIVKRD